MTGCRHNAKNTLVKNYLYLAEQTGADGAPADHGHPGRARARTAATTSRARCTKAKRRAVRPLEVLTADQVVFAAAVARHPAAAAPDEGRGPPARALRPARLPVAHQLRVDPRRDRPRHLDRLQPGRRDHLVVPPRRAHPRRAGALRQGQQRDVAAADRAHRRRRAGRRAGGPGCKEMWTRARAACATSTTSSTGPSAPSSRW